MGMMMPMIKAIIAIGIGILGCFLFGVLGSMTYPGVGAIAGAGIGFLLFTFIGCCALGVYKDLLPKPENFDTAALVPSFVNQAMGKHGKFTLIVTVHKATDVSTMKGLNPFGSPDVYVTVESGNNPPKATCVKKSSNPEFNEQFKLLVQPNHKSVVVRLMDQDVFGSDDVGYVTVDIDQDIIGRGFPQEEPYVVQAGTKGQKAAGKSKVYLSFDYTDDFPWGQTKQARMQNPEMYDKRIDRMKKADQTWHTQGYGSCAHLQTLQFNTSYEENIKDRAAGETRQMEP